MCQGLGPKKHDEISEIDRNCVQELRRVSRGSSTARGQLLLLFVVVVVVVVGGVVVAEIRGTNVWQTSCYQ